MTSQARLRTTALVVLFQYLGLFPIAALLAMLCLLHASRFAGLAWFAMILIPPYCGALLARPTWPTARGLHPAALALGSAGGCVLGVWAGQDGPEASVILLEVLCSLGGAFLMTFWPMSLKAMDWSLQRSSQSGRIAG